MASPSRRSARTPTDDRDVLARNLLDCLLRQVMVDGVFHADPHPGNVILLSDGRLGLLDFGSVGRIDAGMRGALQRLLLAVDHGDPTALTDALLEIVERPDAIDEERLRRSLGRFVARHVAAGVTPDASMFTDLFRIVSDHGLAIPPEIAAVFRSLATMEGTITRLAPGFDIVARERRRFAADYLDEQFGPDSLQGRRHQRTRSPSSPSSAACPVASTGSASRSRPDASTSTCGFLPTTVIVGT